MLKLPISIQLHSYIATLNCNSYWQSKIADYFAVYIMQTGYKEREDRIAELEEFINDQVTELDKMEVAMKQTVANKQLLQEDYQRLEVKYSSDKVHMLF